MSVDGQISTPNGRASPGNGANEGSSVVASCLCLKLRMVARTTGVLYDKALQPTGLSSSQFSALRNIYRFVPFGISELAKVMLLERTTLTRNLELLTAKGLLELRASTSDGRVYKPMLTPLGIDTLKSAIPRWRLAQRRFFGGLGAPGWADLLSTLRATAAINEHAPHRLYVASKESASVDVEKGPGIDQLDTQRCANSTLRGAARHVTREYDAALRTLGIKSTQLHVLAAIDENPNCRLQGLAALLSLDQSSATLAVSGMRRAGWIESEQKKGREPAASRPHGLALTPSGQLILSKAVPLWLQTQTIKARAGPDQALLKWSTTFDNALVAALKAQIL
ncbi:MAG TPA: MarR family transcriptional regulator [Alphaproteobacteria bacterium]